MKVQIIGVGVVGSTIANNIIIGAYDVDELLLVDVEHRRLTAEYRDLVDAKNIAGRNVKIIPLSKPEYKANLHIIAVGERQYFETMNELMPSNYPLVKELVKRLQGKILIVTNPADKITRLLKHKGYNVAIAGDILDHVREGRGYTGKEIREGKGYTNFGIASEVLNYVKQFTFQKPPIVVN